MIPPIHHLKKADILKLASKRCSHGHTYLSHYNCYVAENPDAEEKIGFLDIEASNLSADFGQMLSYCIKDASSDEILEGLITREDLQGTPGEADRRIVTQCVADIAKFDKIVTFYGARFDLPFIRTRALVCGVEFPNYGTLKHKDLWFVCRGKLKLSSNRLENACRVVIGKTRKTRIEPKYWHGALQGDQKSLDFIIKHNRYDVLDLEALYKALVDFSRPVVGSI